MYWEGALSVVDIRLSVCLSPLTHPATSFTVCNACCQSNQPLTTRRVRAADLSICGIWSAGVQQFVADRVNRSGWHTCLAVIYHYVLSGLCDVVYTCRGQWGRWHRAELWLVEEHNQQCITETVTMNVVRIWFCRCCNKILTFRRIESALLLPRLSFPVTSLHQITSLFSPNFPSSQLLFLRQHFILFADFIP